MSEQDDLSTWQPGIDYPEAVTAARDERIAELEAELLAAQEREKALHRIANSEHFDAPERDETHPPAIIARDWARAALAGSPSEKPGSEQKQGTLSTSDYTTTMATGAGVREEKPGSEEDEPTKLEQIRHLIEYEYRLKDHDATLIINTIERVLDAD